MRKAELLWQPVRKGFAVPTTARKKARLHRLSTAESVAESSLVSSNCSRRADLAGSIATERDSHSSLDKMIEPRPKVHPILCLSCNLVSTYHQ